MEFKLEQLQNGFSVTGPLWVEANACTSGGALVQVGTEFLDDIMRQQFRCVCRSNGELNLPRVRITVEKLDS